MTEIELIEIITPHGWRWKSTSYRETICYEITRTSRPRSAPSVMTSLLLLAGAVKVTRHTKNLFITLPRNQ